MLFRAGIERAENCAVSEYTCCHFDIQPLLHIIIKGLVYGEDGSAVTLSNRGLLPMPNAITHGDKSTARVSDREFQADAGKIPHPSSLLPGCCPSSRQGPLASQQPFSVSVPCLTMPPRLYKRAQASQSAADPLHCHSAYLWRHTHM